jgi:hypothetical protein
MIGFGRRKSSEMFAPNSSAQYRLTLLGAESLDLVRPGSGTLELGHSGPLLVLFAVRIDRQHARSDARSDVDICEARRCGDRTFLDPVEPAVLAIEDDVLTAALAIPKHLIGVRPSSASRNCWRFLAGAGHFNSPSSGSGRFHHRSGPDNHHNPPRARPSPDTICFVACLA